MAGIVKSKSLRVFGRLPVTKRRDCTEAGVRKPLTYLSFAAPVGIG